MNYNIDKADFRRWYNEKSKYPMLIDANYHTAKAMFSLAFAKKQPPRFKLIACNAKSGKDEFYPPDFDFSNVVPFGLRD